MDHNTITDIKLLREIIDQQNIKLQQYDNLKNPKANSIKINNTQDLIPETINEKQPNNISFEYICLSCNQLFTAKDIFKHSQQNKDHINHCFHIDDIHNQLSDISKNIKYSSNKNNIFKKRIETIWSELKRLSTTHSSLNSKIDEISNHFKVYYEYLIIKEHSLKKSIQLDIDLINNDIIHQIEEFKSIVKIININKINYLDRDNIDTHLNEEEEEDTTDKYTLSTIIKSIQQLESYNIFIEKNKNTLFYFNNIQDFHNNNLPFLSYIHHHNRQFKSSLTNPTQINSQSKHIQDNQYIVTTNHSVLNGQFLKIIDDSIIVETPPSILVRMGNFKGLKQHYIRNNIIKLEYNHHNNSKQQIEIRETIIEILKSNRIDILDYLIHDLHFDIKTLFNQDGISVVFGIYRGIYLMDLLCMATIYSNLETVIYIDSLGIKNGVKWRYNFCLELSPFSNNIKILQYLSAKVLKTDTYQISTICVSFNATMLGHLDMIEWISKSTPFIFSYSQENEYFSIYLYAMDAAAKYGHFGIVKWLHENRTDGCTTDAIDLAAENGHLEIIKWLHENRSEGCTTDAMHNAVDNGHLEIIKWLHENRIGVCSTDAMDNAAWNGNLEIIKWLHENRTEGCTTLAMDNAARNGHLETIKWLHENRTEGCTNCSVDYASINGRLEIIKWLHENRTEGCTHNAMDYAAEYGHLEIIKWLHENRPEGCTTWAMDKAAKNGHLEIVKWLHENRTEGCTTLAMDNAAENGHLETIIWLHENRTEGCTTSAMDWAAWNGHLEIIKWLQENRTEGCTTNAIDYATEYGHLETIKWLHENRTEGCTTNAMDNAAEYGHLETIKWLDLNRNEGCTTDAMDGASKNGHLGIIIALHENRTEGCTTDAMDKAAMNGHLETIKWLHENRTEGCTANAMEYASAWGQLEIMKWLHENRTEGSITKAMEYGISYDFI